MAANPKAFKHGLGEHAIRRIARNVKRAQPSFSDRAFVRTATAGLHALELKARVKHVVKALRKHLPAEELEAIRVLVRAGDTWDEGDPDHSPHRFAAWPVIEFVGEYGLEHFDVSMQALRKLTGLFSAEFAIRGFIERYETRTLKLLASWTRDPDPHVRRLVSEGTRPRLPWGRRLEHFREDPRPVLRLLEKLKDDPEQYVRRSVANNLNDISKDHANAVVEVCRCWAKGASADCQWVIRRATRTLVKQGQPEALELLGFDPKAKLRVECFTLAPSKLELGEDLDFSFRVRSTASRVQALVIDFAVHHVRQSGKRTSKVFKLRTLNLGPGATASVTKKHKIRRVTTRRYYSGRHALEILVNGQSRARVEFDLVV